MNFSNLGFFKKINDLVRTRTFDYIILVAVVFLTINIFVFFFDFDGEQKITIYLRRMGDAMFFSLPAYFLYKKRFLFIYIILFNMYILTNIWYYRNYSTIMPLTSYLLFENLNGLGPSIINSIRVKDIFLILPSVCYFIYYSVCKRNVCSRRFEWKFFLLSLSCFLVVILPYYVLPMKEGQQYPTPIDSYRHEIINACYQYGIVNYWIYQYMFLQGCDDSEKVKACSFVKEYGITENKAPLLVENSGKNLILVIVESLQTWPMALNIDGHEITPNLNSLIREENTLFLPKVLPQVSGGRSADAQLLINTGLLPIRLGAVATLYATHEFPALSKYFSLMGYYSATLICDDKAYWNQETTCKSYGFEDIYDNLGNEIKYRSDEVLFKEAVPLLKDFKQPFYAQLVTYSGHDPVDTDFKTWINDIDFASTEVKNSLKITEYVDSCIGQFIKDLKNNGLYDNSIIIITGDHDGISFNKYEGRDKCLLEDRFVPFIVLNSPLKVETDKVVGQSDLFPTILDIMGVDSFYRGLGESVFRNISDCAVYHTGEVCGSCRNDLIIEYKKELWTISDILIRMNYFKQEKFYK